MSSISSFFTIKEYSGDKAVNLAHLSKTAKEPFSKMMKEGKCRFFAIVVLNKTLGRIFLFTDLEDKELADGRTLCYFSNLWVHPKLRGQKIGSKLVRFVEKEAKKCGFEFLALGVDTDNEKNISIYKHLGYNNVIKQKSESVFVKDENNNFASMKEYFVLTKKL